MKTVSTINRKVCQDLRSELDELLKKYGTQLNLDIKVGKMKFTDTSVDMAITATVIGGKSIRDEKLDIDLQYNSRIDQLSLEVVKNRQLTGYNSRSKKYPYIYKDLLDGKMYKCTRASAKLYFTTPESMKRRVIGPGALAA